MSKKRIAVAGFQHETNTFCPYQTKYADFEVTDSWPGLTMGEDILTVFPKLNIPIGGFISALYDWQIVPMLWASAEPAGLVDKEAFDRICMMITDKLIAQMPLDGVYLDLHGAMVAQEFDDGELEIVCRVRQVIGESIPLVCSLDLHANISPQFVDQISAMTIFRHYPHIDMAQTGQRAANIMNTLIDDKSTVIYKSFTQIDYLIPLSSQGTTRYPFNEIYSHLIDIESDGVISVDLAAGFPAADIPNAGPSVFAMGTNKKQVELAAVSLKNRFLDNEANIEEVLLSAEDAINQAGRLLEENSMPVVLADVQDNPGAGGSCDTTTLLEELIRQDGAKAIVGIIFDPQAVNQSWQVGVGGEIECCLGNAYDIEGAKSFLGKYIVETVSDEPIKCSGQMYGGCDADLGRMAVLRVKNTNHEIRVLLASKRFQCVDLALFRQVGMAIEMPQIIVVKSTVHFLADFEPVSQKVLFVQAPGFHPCKLSNVSYQHLRPSVRIGPMGKPLL